MKTRLIISEDEFGRPGRPLLDFTGMVSLSDRRSERTKSIFFDIFPKEDVRDCDSDLCRLGRVEFFLPDVDLLWYPTVVVRGLVNEWRVADKIGTHYGGEPRYVPEPTRDWVPRILHASVEQV